MVAWGVVSGWELPLDVQASFEVGEVFVKAPAFHVVLNAGQHVILSLNFSNNCLPVDFEFCTSLMVTVVPFDFSIGCGVVEGMGCLS